MKSPLFSCVRAVLLPCAAVAGLSACSLGEPGNGSVSFSVTAPARAASGSTLYYTVGIVNAPGGVRDLGDGTLSGIYDSNGNLIFKGGADQVYGLALASGTVTEGVATEITVSNVQPSDSAVALVWFGETRSSVDFSSQTNFADWLALYQGISEGVFSVAVGETARTPVTMSQSDVNFMVYLDFSGTGDPYSDSGCSSDGNRLDRMSFDATVTAVSSGTSVYSTTGASIATSNSKWDGRKDDNSRLFLNHFGSASGLSALSAGTKVRGTITLYDQNGTARYTGTIPETTIWRAGMTCTVRMR